MGGKFGEKLCEDLNIKFMGELIKFSREELLRRYDERSGQFLYNIARGIDLENVTPRLISKSIGCCKKFPGRNAISAITTLTHWLTELGKEIVDRLEEDESENSRRPKQMVVSFIQTINNVDVSASRTMNLTSIDLEKIVADAVDLLKKNTDKFFKSSDCIALNNPIKFLGFNVGKFESTEAKKGNTIQNMFQRCVENKKNEAKQEAEATCDDTVKNSDADTNGEREKTAATEVVVTKQADDPEKAKIAKEEELKKSFFYNYHRMRKEAEVERLKAEQERIEEERAEQERVEEEYGDDDVIPDSDEEDAFQNEMLMEELERNNGESHTRRSNSPVASTSAATAEYMQTYAEFYQPPPVTLPKVQCAQCGKQVYAHEIQIHTDEHLAFQLTQEQRDEFRSQLKRATPATSMTPSGKKQKTTAGNSKTKTPTNGLPSIQRFLMKPDRQEETIDAVASTSSAADIETEKCAECGKHIRIIDLFEHMDYHAAKKLQDELMKSELQATQSQRTVDNTSKNVTAGKSKKATKKTNATATNGVKAVKNIASFFQ